MQGILTAISLYFTIKCSGFTEFSLYKATRSAVKRWPYKRGALSWVEVLEAFYYLKCISKRLERLVFAVNFAVVLDLSTLQDKHNTRALSVNYKKNQSDNTIVTHTLKPSIIICDHVTKNDPIESIDIL